MNHATPPDDDDALPDWARQRDALRQLHREVLDEPVPLALLAAAERAEGRRADQTRWMRWGGMAAGLLMAFAAGWLASGQWSPGAHGRAMARGPLGPEFVHAAAVAHAVYAPEKRHPVEVAAAEQQHLVQWLSRRLDRPLKVPDLSAEGYTLVGGRLLPGDQGARAQFMFEDGAGQRITLYLGALNDGAAVAQSGGSAFSFSAEGPVPSFYWVEGGFGYALAGKLPRESLLRLATVVYRQL